MERRFNANARQSTETKDFKSPTITWLWLIKKQKCCADFFLLFSSEQYTDLQCQQAEVVVLPSIPWMHYKMNS